jgi:hypothetical protein
MRRVSDEVVDKIITHISCLGTFFEHHVMYDITWKNIVEWDRPQMKIWHMCSACWILKATNTESQ